MAFDHEAGQIGVAVRSHFFSVGWLRQLLVHLAVGVARNCRIPRMMTHTATIVM
ncbi:MAG TPA: hypothetical protein VIH34_02430 [Candidatus Bathyarchaeia archaeon]